MVMEVTETDSAEQSALDSYGTFVGKGQASSDEVMAAENGDEESFHALEQRHLAESSAMPASVEVTNSGQHEINAAVHEIEGATDSGAGELNNYSQNSSVLLMKA